MRLCCGNRCSEWRRLTFSTAITMPSKHAKNTKRTENFWKRKDGLFIKLVELDSLLSWCLFSPSLVTETRLFPQVINCAFLIFYIPDRIIDSDLQKQLSLLTAAKLSVQDQVMCLILCPPRSHFSSVSMCLASPTDQQGWQHPLLSVFGKTDERRFVKPSDPAVVNPTGEATRKLIILSSEWDLYCK